MPTHTLTRKKTRIDPTASMPRHVVRAAGILNSHSFGRLLRHDEINNLVLNEPLAVHGGAGVPAAYGHWHLFETVDWGDGITPTTSTICSAHGGEMALRDLAAMLWLKRAPVPGLGQLRYRFQLVFAMKNRINGAVAWVDCETGEITKGKPWKDAEALTAEALTSGKRGAA